MPPKQIDLKDLQDRFSEILDQSKPGDEILVMVGNRARAKLIPIESRPATRLGLHPGAFQMSTDFNEPLPEDFWLGRS